jgi:hypothetical protein
LPDAPDVVCPDLGWIHFEVKCVERLNIQDAMDQARSEGAGKVPVVAHKRNHRAWLVTMTAEAFFQLLREGSGEGARGNSPLRNSAGNGSVPLCLGGECLRGGGASDHFRTQESRNPPAADGETRSAPAGQACMNEGN